MTQVTQAEVIAAAKRAGIPMDMVPYFAAIIQQESGGSYDPYANSAGAVGPAQKVGFPLPSGGENLQLWAERNLLAGASEFAMDLNTFHDPSKAIAAYYTGPANVQKYGISSSYGNPTPAAYVSSVLGIAGREPDSLAYPQGGPTVISGQFGTGSAADWTSTDITGSGGGPSVYGGVKSVAKDVTGAFSGVTGWVENILQRGGMIVLGAGLMLLGLYLVARSFGAAPSPGQLVGAVATKGKSLGGGGGGGGGSSPPAQAAQEDTGGGEGAPRRRGDAAIARGEPVTRAGLPRPNTARQNRQAARRNRPRPPGRGEPGSSKLARGDEIPF